MATTVLFCFYEFNFFFSLHIPRYHEVFAFTVLFISLAMVPSSFIHVVAKGRIFLSFFKATQYFIVCMCTYIFMFIYFIYIYMISSLSIHLLVDSWVASIPLAITSNTAVNIEVHGSFQTGVFVFFE